MDPEAKTHSKNANIQGYLKSIGPGLLYAGAAVGVSHLVQSTRAGAAFGFALIGLVILANILKYPFFEYGPRYAIATGESLIEGYQRMGRWALILFVIITIGTVFAVQAAVTIVTAGLASHIFGLGLSPIAWSTIILAICATFLAFGRFQSLDKLIKLVIVVLAITTIIAVIVAFNMGYVHKDPTSLNIIQDWETFPIAFAIALMGWMPAPVDIAVWHSVWTLEKEKTSGHKAKLKESLFDFHMGYWGAAFLSLCFLSLGAMIMFGSEESISSKGAVFAGQFVDLYTESLGSWAYLTIAVSALTTMFSTTITLLDAYPRVLQRTTLVVAPSQTQSLNQTRVYWVWLIVVSLGALSLLAFLSDSMTFMVDLATILSFLAAPVLGFMNFKLIKSSLVPQHLRPGNGLKITSWIGMVFLVAFSLLYLYYLIRGF